MQNLQNTFETRKRSLISAFLIYMTVPLSLKESIFETRKKVIYFTSKAFFVLEIFIFLEFQNLEYHDVIKYISMKHEIQFNK